MNWQAVDLDILGPALAAGLVVLATHVPLGREVLRRGIIFLDLAVAQIAGLGVIAAAAVMGETSGPAVQLSAFGAALAGALTLAWCERRWPEIQEAIIGSAFVLAASLGLLLLANDPHGGEQLKELLVGQILWVGWETVATAAVVTAFILSLWIGLPRQRRRLFYALFALAITTAVQLVGVYLVFASLIIPALAVRGAASGASGIALGYGIGIAGYLGGLVESALFDLPAGPLIVLNLAAIGLLSTAGIVTQHTADSP